MGFSQIRKLCNKCGRDGTYYIPKFHYGRDRKRCEGTFIDTEVFDVRAINMAVLKYLVKNYGESSDNNERLAFGNSVMYALGASDQEQPIVRHFWQQFTEK